MKKINESEYDMEKIALEFKISSYKMSGLLGVWHDAEQQKEHNTNLKKLDAMKKQETEEWKKKWLRN